MRAECHACPTVPALHRLSLAVQGYCPDKTGFCALAATGAQITLELHTAFRPPAERPRRTGPHTRGVLAVMADDHVRIALYPTLGANLDGRPLQRGVAGVYSAAGKHAAKAADASLRMGHLQSTPAAKCGA